MKQVTQNRKSGFTLIELSIVLVIIGLIVGGVLVGQDLIKAAELRAAVGQFEKYDAAVNTFRTKYNGLPGDIQNPTNFGFNATGISTANNGNGFLNRTADDANDYDSESAAFFSHMATANLVAETIAATDFTKANVDTASDYMPASRLGRGLMLAALGNAGTNYFFIGVPVLADGDLSYANGTGLPVIDAYNMDVKMDDGLPATGKVTPMLTLSGTDGGASIAADICVNSDLTPDGYNISTTAYQTDTECQALRIRGSF